MGAEQNPIRRAEKRTTVQVTFPDGATYEGPLGAPLAAFLTGFPHDPSVPIVAAIFRKELCELSRPVREDGQCTPLDIATADGARIYRRSLVFLLLAAARELFPGLDIAVDHSVSDGGYYCAGIGRTEFTDEELERIAGRMREIVDVDEPILRREVPLAEAVAIFERQGYPETVRLLRARQKDYLSLYRLRGLDNYFHGYMVPSAGYLKYFRLESTPPGFTLRFPRRFTPSQIRPNGDFPKLRAAFREYGHWQERLALDDVGMLNESIERGRGRELVLVSEALHDQKIAEIARAIVAARKRVRLVLIAGPSSSGKTTSSRRLAVQMLSQGMRPFPLELDDFFVDRDQTPLDEQGHYDFESFDALDRTLLNDTLNRLLRGEEVRLPKYDFKAGKRVEGDTLRLPDGTVVIMEGIHGLNPELLPAIRPEHIYRIYVSALTQLNLDRHNRVSTTDTRLIRRLVRDVAKRGHPPGATLERWESVRRGERRNIFPFQENADVMFNSALAYELSVLRPIADPLLRQVDPDSDLYVEAKRLLAFLAWFRPLSADFVPDDSILREFIGGSILEQFRVWGA